MKNKARKFLAVAALLVGVACLLYPTVGNAIFGAMQQRVAQENIVAVGSMDSEAVEEQLALAHRYNEGLANGRTAVSDPFDPDSPVVGEEEYFSLLDASGNGVMSVLTVPSADIMVPVYHGTSDEALSQGAGHLMGTSLPVGGAGSHCVVAGHTGLPSVKIFDKLDTVSVGDYLYLETMGESLCYRVVEREVVEPDQTDSLVMQEGRDLLTLVTCTPYGVNSHRLLVHAERSEFPADVEEAVPVPLSDAPSWRIGMLLVLVLGVALAVALAWRRRRQP